MISKPIGVFFLLLSLYLIGQFEDVEVLKRWGAYGCLGFSIPVVLYEYKFTRNIFYGVNDD